jgi:putative FmdB family regulatory protein
MPIYEYRCYACGEVFERLRPIDQRRYPEVCPACGGTTGQLVEIPSSPARRQLLDRKTARKHAQPDEWDPALRPRKRQLGRNEPITREEVEDYAEQKGTKIGRRRK